MVIRLVHGVTQHTVLHYSLFTAISQSSHRSVNTPTTTTKLNIIMSDTLLLNADGAPLSITPLSTLTWQESIKLIWLDKINGLEWHDGWGVHSPNHTLRVPSVIAIREYIPQSGGINFSRTNVFIRDKYTCQYCLNCFDGLLLLLLCGKTLLVILEYRLHHLCLL